MRIIEVRPNLKGRFEGYWTSFESPGVEPTYRLKQHAIDYACQRFGGIKGEVRIYAEDNSTIERVIPIDGGNGYASVSRETD